MNLYLIENDKKVEVDEYVQVGHRIMHKDDVLFSDLLADSAGLTGRLADCHPGKESGAFEAVYRTAEGQYLLVEVHGDFTVQNAAALIEGIARRYDSSEYDGLLIDFRLTRLQTTTVEQYYLVHDLVSANFNRIGKVAFVTDAPNTGFFERAARNRMIDLKFFEHFETADSWVAPAI